MIHSILVALALIGLCATADAQQSGSAAGGWPSKPVKILVGASPGGGTDIIARMLGEKYQAAFGQPFIVENRPGAAGNIGAEAPSPSLRPMATRS